MASIPQRSPFRYPGGKTWLVPVVRQWISSRNRPREFLEPFVGGGARLYTHNQIDHEQLFCIAQGLRGDFLMTYDNDPDIVAMAERHGFQTRLVPMKSSHHAEMTELLIGRDLTWLEAPRLDARCP